MTNPTTELMQPSRTISINKMMLRALRDGDKTEARLPIEPQPTVDHGDEFVDGNGVKSKGEPYECYSWGKGDAFIVTIDRYDFDKYMLEHCPYGGTGGYLQVSEAPDIILEVVAVRVEQVQNITPLQAANEGLYDLWVNRPGRPRDWDLEETYREREGYLKRWFRFAWDEAYAATYPWESNPWVWVVEFRRVTP